MKLFNILRFTWFNNAKTNIVEDTKEELSPIAKSFWMENRRVSNKLLCKTLGYKLIYKNYKIGLKNCYLNSEK